MPSTAWTQRLWSVRQLAWRPAWLIATLRAAVLRPAAGVRGRVALLLLAAAVPILLLASAIAWQDYRMVAGQPLARAELIRAAAAARYQAMLEDAAQVLAGIAALPGVAAGGPSCTAALGEALALEPVRYASFWVLDAAGHPECSVGPALGAAAGPATPWFMAAQEAGRFTVSEPADGDDGADRGGLIAAVPRTGPAGFAGVVAGRLIFDWPTEPAGAAPPAYAWLIDPPGRVVALGPAPPAALPADPALASLLAAPASALAGLSRGGALHAYAVAALDGRLRLLVATPAGPDEAAARDVLLHRLAGLLLLLGAGLGAVALGANWALVRPIKRLSASVQAWRHGAAFDPGPQRGPPAEVRQLSASFATATAALAEREAQLQIATEQQELLMQEIHHRVKNNLQIIASLMNLQASRIRLPEAKREFAAARDRIRALATLHRHLYAHGDLHTINMGRFLHELCDQLLQAMGETAGGRIRLEIDATPVELSSDQAVPIALIVTEAVSNAAKYAFPGGRAGHIQVSLAAEAEHARLVIRDDGVGLPAGPAATEIGVRDGIGLQLIRGFARQLGGQLAVTQDGGTRYQLDLELRRQRSPASEEAAAALG